MSPLRFKLGPMHCFSGKLDRNQGIKPSHAVSMLKFTPCWTETSGQQDSTECGKKGFFLLLLVPVSVLSSSEFGNLKPCSLSGFNVCRSPSCTCDQLSETVMQKEALTAGLQFCHSRTFQGSWDPTAWELPCLDHVLHYKWIAADQRASAYAAQHPLWHLSPSCSPTKFH